MQLLNAFPGNAGNVRTNAILFALWVTYHTNNPILEITLHIIVYYFTRQPLILVTTASSVKYPFNASVNLANAAITFHGSPQECSSISSLNSVFITISLKVFLLGT